MPATASSISLETSMPPCSEIKASTTKAQNQDGGIIVNHRPMNHLTLLLPPSSQTSVSLAPFQSSSLSV